MAALEKNYDKALAILRSHIDNGLPFDHWEPLLSATMTRKMYSGAPLPAVQRRRLVIVMTGGIGVYSAIAAAIGQTDRVGDDLRRVCGDYRYFRQDNPASAELSEGRVRIVENGGDVCFQHWSPDWRKREAEHEGYAFLVDKRLFMLAWKPNVIRLGIAYCPEDHEGVMSGYVLSVRSGGSHPIFSAPSVLIHVRNKDELALFRSSNAHEHFVRRHNDHQTGYMPG